MSQVGFDLYGSTSLPGPRCPSCQGGADVAPHPDWHWVCRICGAPRIPGPAEQSDDVRVLLLQADASRKSVAKMWAITIGAVCFGFLALLVAVGGLLVGPILALPPTLLGVLPAIVAVMVAQSKIGLSRTKLADGVHAAWVAASADRIHQGGVRDAQALAKALSIPLAFAERLMSEVSVNAELGMGSQVRIGLEPLPADPRFAELERAAREEAEFEEAAGSPSPARSKAELP